MNKPKKLYLLSSLCCFGALFITGCSSNNGHYVVATSSTLIGIEVAQNPASQIPEGKLGYSRHELALVPTDRMQPDNEPRSEHYEVTYDAKDRITKEIHQVNSSGISEIKGSDKSTDVLMELKATGLLSFNASVYQRLAVGENAVKQPGAALMFSRDAEGKTDAEAVKAAFTEISKKTETIPLTEITILNQYKTIIDKFAGSDANAAAVKAKVEAVDVIPDDLDIKLYSKPTSVILSYTKSNKASFTSAVNAYDASVTYLGDLSDSIDILKNALNDISAGIKIQFLTPAPPGITAATVDIDPAKVIELTNEKDKQMDMLTTGRKAMRESNAIKEMVIYLEKSETK